MTIESLNCESWPHIPDGCCFICWTTYKEISERLEIQSIYWISVTSELLPQFQWIEIEQFDWTITWRRKNEITCIMEFKVPDWPSMNILKCMSNWWIDKIPHLNALITSTSYQMTSSRMEINSAYPILVTFSGHDIFFIFQVPDFPSAVITSRCNNLLLGMHGHTTNSSWLSLVMSFNLLVNRHPFHEVIESLWKVWIWSGIFWPWCVLAFDSKVVFYLASHSLLLHTSINLSLHFLFMLINGFC